MRLLLSGRPLVLAVALGVSACAGAPSPPPIPPAQEAAATDRELDTAEQIMAEGQVDEAAQLYARVLTRAPENPRARLGAAEVQLARGEHRAARRLFHDLTKVPEVAARANQGLGLSMIAVGHTVTARPPLETAVAADSNLWRAWNALGNLDDADHRWADAEQAYGKALETAPDRAAILNNQGFSLMLQKRWAEAVDKLTQAVREKPDFQLARNNLRLALAWQGRYVEALAGVPKEGLPTALNNVGYAAMIRGDYPAAEGYLTRAMESSTSYFEPAALNLLQLDSLKPQEGGKK